MNTHKITESDLADLRRRAEKSPARAAPDPRNLSAEDAARLLHELQVHQIKLEMQNEELRRTQQLIQEAHDRYVELYDLASIGYLTLDERGQIVQANLTAATMLGVERSDLLKRYLSQFVDGADQVTYYHHQRKLFATGAPQTCELVLIKAGGSYFHARLESRLATEPSPYPDPWRMLVSDVTGRVRAEELIKQAVISNQ